MAELEGPDGGVDVAPGFGDAGLGEVVVGGVVGYEAFDEGGGDAGSIDRGIEVGVDGRRLAFVAEKQDAVASGLVADQLAVLGTGAGGG